MAPFDVTAMNQDFVMFEDMVRARGPGGSPPVNRQETDLLRVSETMAYRFLLVRMRAAKGAAASAMPPEDVAEILRGPDATAGRDFQAQLQHSRRMMAGAGASCLREVYFDRHVTDTKSQELTRATLDEVQGSEGRYTLLSMLGASRRDGSRFGLSLGIDGVHPMLCDPFSGLVCFFSTIELIAAIHRLMQSYSEKVDVSRSVVRSYS